MADAVNHLPAQTYKTDNSTWNSALPLGSQFELTLWILHDYLSLRLMAKMNRSSAMMAQNHRILE